VEIYTIGFAGKTAEAFFGTLKRAGVRRVIDIRLRPNGGLSLFARGTDLPYFLRELCRAEYVHVPLLAPTKDILSKPAKPGTVTPFSTCVKDNRRPRLTGGPARAQAGGRL
jgi:uncharacterized protein (DUF488 family)